MDFEFEVFFKNKGSNAKTRDYFITLKRSTNKVLDYVLGDATQEDIRHAESEILRFSTPKNYYGSSGEEVKFINGFETSFINLSQHVPKDPRLMTVLEYYRTLEIIEKKITNG